MHMKQIIGLLVLLCCELCLTIKVPTTWNESGNSAVSNESNDKDDNHKQQNVQTLQQSQPIPIDYFQYTAKKPQFAIDVAAFHGVKNPEQHYKAYPIIPYTGKEKPVLGIHHLLNEDRNIYQPYQKYVQKVERTTKYVNPMSASYEVFHPYEAEVPALQELYKDPILNKIRNDLHDSKNRLQAYEQDAGQPNISDDEYLEKIKHTESKLFPQKNVPAQYELHRPERRPSYYRIPPRDTHRDHVLNQRFKHPWNEHGIKIRPLHYKPLKKHLHNLRQQHALKYDDEKNEYPQLQLSENIAQKEDGYDIYEKGKQKYTQLRNNLDESINKAILENRPETYQKLELQSNQHTPKEVDDEFIPVKNYAQVRKIETIKHLPKKAAFDDADTYEEILNAPRLREAIKSTKAQIVYSEEGYEDSAYDHAGEQKHALDHEGHGGFLKETAKSGGLFKTPSFSGSYQDGKGSEHRDNIEHEKKWENNDTDNEEEIQAEDYSESEYDESDDADAYKDKNIKVRNRNKREDEKESKVADHDHENSENISNMEDNKHNKSFVESEIHTVNKSHEVDKRETSFEIPTINLDKTYLSESEILKIAKQKINPKKDNIKDKYPYYFKNLKLINENSPLRYAENLKFIPKKSEGGTEFYDSRSKLECPEVEDDIDPIPEKLKNGNNPTEEDNVEEENDKANLSTKKKNTAMMNKPRLSGLGDKIDCFKAKYFGENPLDSPFFKEDIISIPKPILAPKLSIFDHLKAKQKLNYQNPFEEPQSASNTDIFELLNKLRINDKPVQEFQPKLNESSQAESYAPQNNWAANNTQQTNVYTDVLTNIRNEFDHPRTNKVPAGLLESPKDISNKTYNYFQNKEEVTKLPIKIRRKRASQFVYEPYKIIRDSQYQDSKKTTTTSNISPLIRQLQTSRVVDRVSRSNRDDYKPNPKNNSRTYVNIGKNDRAEFSGNPTIVDVSVDQRRGEPRYEIRPNNHKSEYTPVENKRAMSIDDYKTHTISDKIEVTTVKSLQSSPNPPRGRQHFRYTTTTITPVYDVASFLPNSPKASPSNTVRRTVTTTTPIPTLQEIDKMKELSGEDTDESDEDYNDDESDDEEEDDEIKFTTTTTTTTTVKPAFRRRTQVSTTTENINEYINEDQPERLKLVTRFRNYNPSEKPVSSEYTTAPTDIESKYKLEQDSILPKYTEKKKKSSKSTLVTDTKKYGDDDDDDINDDVEEKKIDAMIGVKQNIKDYMPSYEQEAENKERKRDQYKADDVKEDEESNDDDEDDDDDNDGDDDNDDDDDDDDGDDDNEEDYEIIADKEENDEEEESNETKLKVTTPEPTKRTLVQTTEAPPPTVASRFKTTSAPLTNLTPENKPIITRRKIEIHKELPVDKSGPHVTQFKQDIKEVEIIKEMPAPKRKPHRKVKPLELYKDDSLAKDINKLEDVEIFRENLELEKGRKHGGNYRRASKEDLKLLTLTNRANDEEVPPKDVEASQSENRKRVELDEFTPERIREGNQRSLRDGKRTRKIEKKGELVELSNPPGTAMHGGNLKHKGHGGRKSEKLIELDEDRDDEDSTQDDDYKSSPHSSRHDRLHGGNYRSAKLVVEKQKTDDINVNNPAREARRSATILLNRFVQAVPALTTTPGYIVDPSKRMYYYLDV